MVTTAQQRRSRREQLEAQRLAQAKKERRNRILFVAVGVVVFAVVIGLGAWGFIAASTKGGTAVPPNANAAKTGVYVRTADSATPAAGVPVLEEFVDYNCTACRSANLTLSAAMDQAAKDGKIQLIIHPLSFEASTSRDAAIAATCADFQGKFVDYHNQLFIKQTSTGFDSTTLLTTIPDTINLTGDALTAFTNCFNNKDTGKFIDSTARFGAKENVRQTPTFRLDGVDITQQIWNKDTKTYDPDLLRSVIANGPAK